MVLLGLVWNTSPGACPVDPPGRVVLVGRGPWSSTVTLVQPRPVSSSARAQPTMPAPITTTRGPAPIWPSSVAHNARCCFLRNMFRPHAVKARSIPSRACKSRGQLTAVTRPRLHHQHRVGPQRRCAIVSPGPTLEFSPGHPEPPPCPAPLPAIDRICISAPFTPLYVCTYKVLFSSEKKAVIPLLIRHHSILCSNTLSMA